MRDCLLLLPLIYIFHDFEEIIGFGWFFRNNPQLFSEHPTITNAYRDYTPEGMAIGIFEQLILFFGGLSLVAFYFPNKVTYAIWFGMMLGLTAHFIVHFGMSIYIHKFIPSVITSAICLPISVLIIFKVVGFLSFDAITIVTALLTIAAMMLNLKIGHTICFKMGKAFSV